MLVRSFRAVVTYGFKSCHVDKSDDMIKKNYRRNNEFHPDETRYAFFPKTIKSDETRTGSNARRFNSSNFVQTCAS